MMYRLDELAKLAAELGLRAERVDSNRVDISLEPTLVLTFRNLVDPVNTLVAFLGTGWHAHGVVSFMTGPDTAVDCDEIDMLIGLASGELLVVSRHLDGELCDRWIVHKQEPFDLHYLAAGEELRVLRLQTR